MDQTRSRSTAFRRPGWRLAGTAGLVGALYAGVSAYWGAGGSALLDTLGGTLEREARARSAGALVVIWATVLLKMATAAIGLLVIAQPRWLSARWCRATRRAAWLAAGVLTLYGGVLTLVGLLVQAGIVRASAHADQRALHWHAFLWDPWFLVWGLLLVAALALSRQSFTNGLRRPHESRPAKP